MFASGWLNDQRSEYCVACSSLREEKRGGIAQCAQRAYCCCCCAARAAHAVHLLPLLLRPHPPLPPQTQHPALAAEIGLGLAAFGLLFTVLGVMLLFDRGLLAMGNVRLI